MNGSLVPTSVAELLDAVRSSPHVVLTGAGTKPRLTQVPADYARISTVGLRGIVEYEPSEFTFTAFAGTPVKEIVAALGERGQYLPFDPVLAHAGATLGGTVAAGVSGPGRFRFGGLRDFILGVHFVDGEGRLLRMGGKVVKNAAGFDLPKFFVGSLGRYGALADICFKVFPRPSTTRTLRIDVKDISEKAAVLSEAARGRWEIDALESSVDEGDIVARLAGPAEALDVLAAEIFSRWPGRALNMSEAQLFWENAANFNWAHVGGSLVKIVLTPSGVPAFVALVQAHACLRGWIGCGGNVGYISCPAGKALPALRWPALTLRGEAPLWPGVKPRSELMRAVKQALDPQNRFPNLDD